MLVLAVVLAVAARPAAAGPYTGMVVFGDSLSDTGNDAIASTTFPGNLFLTPTPGPYYDAPGGHRRFSNGPVYVDGLAARLGLSAPVASLALTAPAAGGAGRTTDYAYGGVRTAGSTTAQRLVLSDVDQQVNGYESANTPAAGDLFVLFAGANDLFAQLTMPSADPAAAARSAADNLSGYVSSLYSRGARQFLVPNLPLLGETPRLRAQGAAAMAAADGLTVTFNAELAADLATLQRSNAGINIHALDVAGLILAAQSNPGAYGFTNATASAAPGLSPGATSYDTALEVSTPDTYLFWDDIHPTTAGHALLANAAYAAVVPEPAAGAVLLVGVLIAGRRQRRVTR